MSKFNAGDKVKVIEIDSDMVNMKIGDIFTIRNSADPYICLKEDTTNRNWNVKYFELDSILKPGLFFKKDNDLFLVAESVNQRWLVSLTTGNVGWLSGNNVNSSTLTMETKGYKQIDVPKDMFTVLARVNS